jgi:hypothetical protein
VPGLTDGKKGIGRWTEGSKPGTGYLGLPPIKVVKSAFGFILDFHNTKRIVRKGGRETKKGTGTFFPLRSLFCLEN